MGKSIEIECSTNIYIDDYVGDISSKVLINESFNRLLELNNSNLLLELANLIADNDDILIKAIAIKKKLNIIDVDKLKKFLNDLG